MGLCEGGGWVRARGVVFVEFRWVGGAYLVRMWLGGGGSWWCWLAVDVVGGRHIAEVWWLRWFGRERDGEGEVWLGGVVLWRGGASAAWR